MAWVWQETQPAISRRWPAHRGLAVDEEMAHSSGATAVTLLLPNSVQAATRLVGTSPARTRL
jgi:hypothetical protein